MYEYIHKVQYYETDRMGITHHSNYIRWMEESRIDMLESFGWGYAKMEEMGIISPVIGVEVEYKNTTTFYDDIRICVGIKEFKGVRLIVGYKMSNVKTGKIVCVGSSSHCFQNRDGKLIRLNREYPELDQLLKRMATEYAEQE